MIISFCGHSEYERSPEDEAKVLNLLEERVKGKSVEFFLGGYGNFDDFAYNCAKKFKKAHPDTKLIFVTPYMYAKEYQKNRFDIILYPVLKNVPDRYAIPYRNKWMAEQADIVISYITHAYGGAYAMYKHARKKGKEIYNVALRDLC